VLAALAGRVFRGDAPPAGAPPWPAVEETDALARIGGLVARLPGPERRELRAFLGAIEWLAPLRAGRPGARFSRLPGPAQDAVVGFLSAGPIPMLRGAFASLQGLLALGYLSDPATWPAMGYDGPRSDRPVPEVDATPVELGRGRDAR